MWRDLTWPRKSLKFNLHQLRNISMGFKMAVLTPKSGTEKKIIDHVHNKYITTPEFHKLTAENFAA